MTELNSIRGGQAPLFDRLHVAKSSNEQQPLEMLDRQALQDSVQRELTYLFNVQSWNLPARYTEAQYTVLGFGVPDFTTFSPQSGEDCDRLVALLARAITAFEPRPRQVRVVMEPLKGKPQALTGRITGNLVTHSLISLITLTVVLPGRKAANQTVIVEVIARPEP